MFRPILAPLLILLALVGHLAAAHAQSACQLRNFSHELSDSKITDIAQDAHGLIWIATWNGLYRFDNASFKHFKTYPNDACVMESNRLRDIAIGHSGKIWCMDYEYNIYLFDPEREQFFAIPLESGKTPNTKPRFSKIYTTANKLTILCANDRIVEVDESIVDPEQGIGFRTRWYANEDPQLNLSKPIAVLELNKHDICIIDKTQLIVNERHIAATRGGGASFCRML